MMTHPLEPFHFCPVCGSSQWEINNCKSKHCLHCGFVYYANAYASVAAFMHNDQGDLLVCRRKKNPAAGTLDLPGGFVDIGETAEEAVVREIREELGLTVIQSAYLFSLPNEYLYSGMIIPTLDLFFDCRVATFSTLMADDDVSEAFFRPVHTISPDEFGLKSIKKGIIAYLNKNT